jgi:hypothetical protein
MRINVPLSFFFLFFFQGCVQNKYLDQDYKSFDQAQKSGWRQLAQEGRLKEAAKLIDRYLKRNTSLDVSQIVNLHFHAGQLYAFAERNDIALERFKQAKYNPIPDVEPAQMKAFFEEWNVYIDATIAFIKKDKMKLLERRARMANIPNISREMSNLDVVDSLIRNFDKPYSEACGAHKNTPKRTPR